MIPDEKLIEGRYVEFFDQNQARRWGRILKAMPRAGDYIVGIYDPMANCYGTPFHRQRIKPEKIVEAHGMRRTSSPWRGGVFDDSLPEVGEDEPMLEAPEVIADAAREDA